MITILALIGTAILGVLFGMWLDSHLVKIDKQNDSHLDKENKKPSPVDFLKEFEAALDEGKMSDRQRGYEEGYDDGFEEGFAAKEKELKGKCSYILCQKPEVFAKEFAELVEAEKENTEQAYTLSRLFATYISMKINQENGLPF